jgi:AGZA family xanthine/uracil permease-like MFS transporter
LLAPLAGIAITFISMGFIFQIFDNPGIALLPAIIILVCYGAKVKTKLPAGLIAIIVGMGLAAIWERLGIYLFEPSPEKYSFAFHPPVPVPADVFALIKGPMAMQFLSVIIPMGLINVIGSLQNLESAEAAGDRFETRPALLANGIGTMAAAFFGSCFPTTIYIGHPGWKAMGARAAYSTINGVVITAMCLFGGVTLVLQFVPIEATLGILLWIGVIITAQAFGEVPKRHGIAVAVGLIPPLAAWALYLIETALRKADTTLFETAASFGDDRGDVFIYGVIALSQGYLITSLVLAAAMVFIIDKQFYKAAMWMLAASALSIVGLIHAFEWSLNGVKNRFIGMRTDPFMVDVAAPEFGLMYLIGSLVLLSLWISSGNRKQEHEPYEVDA